MSEGNLVYLFPVLARPDPLAFTVESLDEGQPSVVAGCGHVVWREESLIVAGRIVRKSKPNFSLALARTPRWLQRFFAPKQCAPCRLKDDFEAAIACAYCGNMIFRGDPVSIYDLDGELPEGFEARATRTANGWDCCPTGGFFAGHWVGNGVRSPFSTGSAATEALHNGGMVVSNIDSL